MAVLEIPVTHFIHVTAAYNEIWCHEIYGLMHKKSNSSALAIELTSLFVLNHGDNNATC